MVSTSLNWSASPGVAISSTSAAIPSFTISTLGTFSITLTVNNGDGVKTVVNSVTTNTCLDVSVSAIKNQIGFVSVYPNPSSDLATLIISTNKTEVVSASICDITGKLVLAIVENQSLISGENKFLINTNNITNGIYFVTVNTNNGKETVKLIVNK